MFRNEEDDEMQANGSHKMINKAGIMGQIFDSM